MAPEGDAIRASIFDLINDEEGRSARRDPKIQRFLSLFRELEAELGRELFGFRDTVLPSQEETLRLMADFLERMAAIGLDPVERRRETVAFLARLYRAREQRIEDGRVRGADPVREICRHDPRVVLGIPPESTPLDALLRDRHRTARVRKALRRLLGSRAEEAWFLLKGFMPAALAGRHFLVPVLLGPPASGKSYIPQVLAYVLSKEGVRTELLVVHCGTDRGWNEETEMRLLGTDFHWGNAAPGDLFRLSADRDLLIVLVDELDKKNDRRFFLEVFDAGLPLQDRFVRSVAPEVNLRCKVFFVATATEVTWSEGDPLGSRLAVLPVEPLSDQERARLARDLLRESFRRSLGKEHEPVLDLLVEKALQERWDLRKVLGVGSALSSFLRGLSPDEVLLATRAFLRRIGAPRKKTPPGFLVTS